MTKQIWAFADIDDTLIASTRVCPVEGSVVAAVTDKGAVCGWLTPKQSQFLAMFGDKVNFVLTTARTSKGVSQVSLPVAGYSITSFGGVIRRPDGTVEPRFRALLEAGAALAKPILDDLLALAKSTCQKHNIDVRLRIAADDGLDLFLSAKHNQKNLAELAIVRDALAAVLPVGWQLHMNGNFVAAMPPFLGKENAVRWFMDNIAGPDALSIGMGDSLTDLPFMALCDYALMPTKSQSFATLQAPPEKFEAQGSPQKVEAPCSSESVGAQRYPSIH